MWNMKSFVILVIIGAMGIVTAGAEMSGNNTRKAFNRFSTKIKAVLETSRMTSRVLQSET
jgi:hypothetical protein